MQGLKALTDSHGHILEYGASRQLPLEGAKDSKGPYKSANYSDLASFLFALHFSRGCKSQGFYSPPSRCFERPHPFRGRVGLGPHRLACRGFPSFRTSQNIRHELAQFYANCDTT